MIILAAFVGLLLFLVTAMRPVSLKLSPFEVRRRERDGILSDFDARRATYEASVLTLLRLLSALLLVLFVPTIISAFGWVVGIIMSIIVALEYQTIARLKPVRFLADKLYDVLENYLLIFVQKAQWFFKFFKSVDETLDKNRDVRLYSKEELADVLKRSPDVLTLSESRLIQGALEFADTEVRDIMTPRSVIDSIEQSELLGPITLSELHKTGHSRFPVTKGDIDHVVGVLYVRDLLTVDGSKNSAKVSQVMDKTVCFIREDQNLEDALAAFIKTQKLLFIVINEFRETVGILSLEDVLETLVGQKINDEFEKHSDLRAVAERNPRKNNSPTNAQNV